MNLSPLSIVVHKTDQRERRETGSSAGKTVLMRHKVKTLSKPKVEASLPVSGAPAPTQPQIEAISGSCANAGHSSLGQYLLRARNSLP